MSSKGLGKALRRLAGRAASRKAPERGLSLEALLNLRMEHLEKQLDEMKGRVNALVLILLGAVITDLMMRILG